MQTDRQLVERLETAPLLIDIQLLALDLGRCARCVGTLRNIETAIRLVQPVLEVMEVQVNVERIVVESEEQARRYELVTSPTVRVGGNDIAFETLESECESCADLCGCDEGTSCRVWRYRGGEYTEAPVGLVVESVLRGIFSPGHDATGTMPAFGGVPENLRRFFRRRAETQSAGVCCSPTEQQACCDIMEKATCCDASQPATCGCQ